MVIDLTGINSRNEYYTNHYFSSIFQDDAEETIAAWKARGKDEGIILPWKQLRNISRTYYTLRDKYRQYKNESMSKPMIQELAGLYLNALGYTSLKDAVIEVSDNISIPVFHEETKNNGAPLLWILLSVAGEKDEDILDGYVFKKLADEEESNEDIDLNNDDTLSKIFFSGEEAPRFVILVGINQIALIDRNKWNEKRYLLFDLEEIFGRHEETTFMALSVLLHKESLCPSDGTCLLDGFDENSHRHSSSVSEALKYALRECIEILGNEVIYDMKTRQGIDLNATPVDAGELTIECLRYMYRFLFMLFIEARPELGYAPMKSQVYVQGYSLEGIRDICARLSEESELVSEGYYISDTISSLFEMIYKGYPEDVEIYKSAVEDASSHDMFTVEALKAHIFDPEYTKLISKAKLRNVAMLKIVDKMSISRPQNARERRGRISYSALGINQMGAVYEALLSYRGFIAEDTLYEVKRSGDKINELDVGYFVPESDLSNYKEDERVRYEKGDKKGQLRKYEKGTFIYRLAGREREKSASYYTPEVLTKCLVKYALKELLKDKNAEEILNLTICEPAMGSAAFLNEAINQIAEAYLQKRQEELGIYIDYDKRFEELQKVKMFIADRNVYGVDLNPIAVELAEVSLWLNTIYKGAYVPWFGTQLVCGNSLIGARKQVYYTSKLEKGKWYDEAPTRIMPGEKRKRTGVSSRVYHFLLGDPGMSNYTDKVIKGLEPENIKLINDWRKEFTKKYDEEDIKTLLRLSDIIDSLWERTVALRKKVEEATSDPLSIFGHEEEVSSSYITIREKDDIYHRLFKSEDLENAGPYARLKAAMDYWCALWFWPIDKADLLPTRQEFFFELSLILEGGLQAVNANTSRQLRMDWDETGKWKLSNEGDQFAIDFHSQYADLGVVNLNDLRTRSERLAIVNQIANVQRFQHWELEFADVFEEKGGFDLVIGNPPWITSGWSEKELLSEYYPDIQIRGYSAAEINQNRDRYLSEPTVRTQYIKANISASSISRFYDAIVNYPTLKGVQKDSYKCFIEYMLCYMGTKSVVGFVHPEEIYNDSTIGSEQIRCEMYKKLSYHFQFRNELSLFQDVAHSKYFTISIFNGKKDSIGFFSINNLFAPIAVDECFGDTGVLEGIKNENNKWSTRGHKERCNYFDEKSLESCAKIFEEKIVNPLFTRLPSIHNTSLFNILMKYGVITTSVEDFSKVIASEMFHETNSVKEGLIVREEHIPQEPYQCVLSGPNIGECTIYAKIPRIRCSSKGDYDVFNNDNLAETPSYLPRVLFKTILSKNEFISGSPVNNKGESHYKKYRMAVKTLLSSSSEYNLKACIIPPDISHIQSIITFSFDQDWMLLYTCGLLSSVPYLFFLKITGKKKFSRNTINMFPVVGNDGYAERIINRVKLLNCNSLLYKDLWNNSKHKTLDKWESSSHLLRKEVFDQLSQEYKTFVLSDYEKHELMCEIDVMVAKQIGLSLSDLIEIYSIYFPNHKKNEEETYYDRNGRIVFTSNRSYSSKYNLSTQEWEQLNKKEPVRKSYEETYLDNVEKREIVYTPPYYSCSRIELYKEIWHSIQ